VGVRHALFPIDWLFGAWTCLSTDPTSSFGCQFPDAIHRPRVTAGEKFRPHSRAATTIPDRSLLSEASLLGSVRAGTGAPNTALTHPRELPCDRFLCESPPMIGRTAGAFGTALAPRHGSSFLPLRLLFPRSWATPLPGTPPKPGAGFSIGQARRPDPPTPPIHLPTPFAFPPHQGEPWSQELFHTPILRLTMNT